MLPSQFGQADPRGASPEMEPLADEDASSEVSPTNLVDTAVSIGILGALGYGAFMGVKWVMGQVGGEVERW